MPYERLSDLYSLTKPIDEPIYKQAIVKRTTTVALRNHAILQSYLANGYLYIRKLNYNYNHILREPTNGCTVEITKERDFGSVLICSQAGKKLISRISYF